MFVCKHEEAPWGFGHAHFSTILSAVPVPLRYFLYKFPLIFVHHAIFGTHPAKKRPRKPQPSGDFPNFSVIPLP